MSKDEAKALMLSHLESAIAIRLYDIKDSEFAATLGLGGNTSQQSERTEAAARAALDSLLMSAGE